MNNMFEGVCKMKMNRGMGMSVSCYRLCDFRLPYVGKSTGRNHAVGTHMPTFDGCRYCVVQLGGGWVLKDLRPEVHGYVFQKNGKKIYAALILDETQDPKEVSRLVRTAKQLNREVKNGYCKTR